MRDEASDRDRRLRESYEHSGEFLVRETRESLASLARARGVSADRAEDLAQDALTALFTRRPVLRDPERWLVRVVLRRICDFWRRQSAEARALGKAPIAGEPNALDPLRRQRLARALGRLPRKSRLLIRARYFQGRDEPTSARAAGYAPSSFKKMMTRALSALRAEMRPPRR